MGGCSGMAAGRLALLASLLAAVAARAPTPEPELFEAAFQGRCGPGSPCEQLCRELHDGTYECGCAPGFVLQLDGYGCLEMNATKPSDASLLVAGEDVLYQKDVSFSAELEIAPSNSHIKNRPKLLGKHINDAKKRTTTNVKREEKNIFRANYTFIGEKTKEADGIKSLIEDGVSKIDLNLIADEDEKDGMLYGKKITTLGPSLEQKVPSGITMPPPWTAAVEACSCGSCENAKCSCGNNKCSSDLKITTPRFSGSSWLAFHALRGAYKRVRLRVRVRPERARGVLLLTGEHDDLSGDYLALLLRNGHVELRFDCGSGAGVLRSPEPVRLGHWNTISVYRHRWDAWLRLNNGKRVRGRSKGLFSRMTFREPVWIGGAGNTTGLQSKLGLSDGLLGCVDALRINGDNYRLVKDAVAAMDIGECAPTLAPWMPIREVTTNEATMQNLANDIEAHNIYDINDIVHFEDNDLVMRDSKPVKNIHEKIDNSLDRFKIYNFNDVKKILLSEDIKSVGIVHDSPNDIKSDDLEVMKTDKDDTCRCQHGGGCVDGNCLCPLGYAGERCEITLDLKVPRFNGSSYLRLPGLGDTAQSWLDIKITLKPSNGDGLVLFDSELPNGEGDFFSLHLRDYYVEFAFDLGSGIALVRSAYPLKPNKWYSISVSRTGRHATLRVSPPNDSKTNKVIKKVSFNNNNELEEENNAFKNANAFQEGVMRAVTSRGNARKLTLREPLLLGGAVKPLPSRLALRSSYCGCIGQLTINDEDISVVSAALGGVNVDNCEDLDSCKDSICKETINPIPQYPKNISSNDNHHYIVPKKGLSTNYYKIPFRKPKTYKKHPQHMRMEKYKKKKYLQSKKMQYLQSKIERSNDISTDEPEYDGRTYMQVKYLNANEINWGDMNSYPSFSGKDSFIHIDDEETMKRLQSYTLDISIRFRAACSNALLVWSGTARKTPGDFLSLALEDGLLVFRYNLGSGEVVIVANHTKVDDGLWHRARATRNRQAGVLEVDGLGSVGKISPGKLKQLNTENGLYIGGLPSIEENTMGRYKSGLIGCVSQLSLSGDFDIPLSLSKLPHTITNNVGKCDP